MWVLNKTIRGEETVRIWYRYSPQGREFEVMVTVGQRTALQALTGRYRGLQGYLKRVYQIAVEYAYPSVF